MYRCFWRSVIRTHKQSPGRRVAEIRAVATTSWREEQRVLSVGATVGAYSCLALVKEIRDSPNLPRSGSEMDRSAVVALLQTCTKNRSLSEARRVHSQMIDAGVEPDVFLNNLLISMYVKCRCVPDAHRVFKSMPRRDVISWNSLISGYASQPGFKKKAFHLLDEMQEQGFVPNKVTYISMLTACSSPAALQNGKHLHSRIINAGYHRDPRVQNSLLSMYGRCGDLLAARRVFDAISPRDVVSYNAMLGLYARQLDYANRIPECIPLYEQMLTEGISPDDVTYINVLEGLHYSSALQEGQRIRVCIVNAGLHSNVRVGTALVAMFIRCGDVASAREAFEEIVTRDVVAWNAMIAALAQHGHHDDALEYYHRMRSEGVVSPNKATYMSVLNACSTSKALEGGESIGESIYRHIHESRLLSDVQIGNALISMFSRCGDFRRAREFFESMQVKDLISWNAVIAGYARREDRDEVMSLFHRMQSEGVKPGRVTFLHLLSVCGSLAALTTGKAVHHAISTSGIESNIHIGNALINMYRRCGSVSDAQKVFERMPARDVISWNSIIASHAQYGSCDAVFKLFREMQQEEEGCNKPDVITLTSVLSACKNPEALVLGKGIHKQITDSGIPLDAKLGNALISFYTRCGSLDEARDVFDHLPSRDVMSWTAIISACTERGAETQAFELFWRMQREGFYPVKATFSSILRACTSSASLGEGRNVMAYILNNSGYEFDTGVGNALISMYTKSGSMTDAAAVFDRMPLRDVVSWNRMIAGWAHNGQGQVALKLAHRMQSQGGALPNKFTFVSLLNACASSSLLEEGKRTHAEVIKRGYINDVHVAAALITMYAKCGSLTDAEVVFESVPEKNVVTWNAIINAYSQHGDAASALASLHQMENAGIKPDGHTFTSILSACNHAGLVNEGYEKFSAMESQYGVSPSIEHYGCVVGLLGRAGRLNEAVTFIAWMPSPPDAAIWETLLGACRVHGNVEMAERAAAEALKLDPGNPAVYVLLSNVYAAVGRWDDVAKTRHVMEARGVRKEPGRSWIEVDDRVHEFVAGDRSHPRTEDIHDELRRLLPLLESVGYVPDTRAAMHDMGQTHREVALCVHSERLAIAYGLISTPPGTPIRIFKNLRICGDCHTASKFISKLVGREIVARDANRFHRFRNGKCSCEDFW